MTDIKLSTAIREGAKLHPQSHRAYYEDGKTCTLGAAAEATGYDWHGYNFTEDAEPLSEALRIQFDVLNQPVNACPSEGCAIDLDDWEKYDLLDGKMFGLVAHLNDDHKWTREAIADWLESLGY